MNTQNSTTPSSKVHVSRHAELESALVGGLHTVHLAAVPLSTTMMGYGAHRKEPNDTITIRPSKRNARGRGAMTL
ncbi:MAG: hypothetical protein JWL82_368 [Parcubacteria group bacterium]|nr:hypothetical protein [Parcubacteria group bacterium]